MDARLEINLLQKPGEIVEYQIGLLQHGKVASLGGSCVGYKG